MKRISLGIAVIIVFILGSGLSLFAQQEGKSEVKVKLPPPRYESPVSVEEAIFTRKSVRRYGEESLTLEEVSQLLWAAGGATCDGITGATRAYPSAGARYPLEIYLIVGDVEGLSPGIYRYHWEKHELSIVREGDLRPQLMQACYGQRMVGQAPASLLFTANYRRTTGQYGKRGERYVHMDTGHAGENVHLQAEALGLGTVVMGAFLDEAVKRTVGLKDEEPLYVMPVGRKVD